MSFVITKQARITVPFIAFSVMFLVVVWDRGGFVFIVRALQGVFFEEWVDTGESWASL